MKFALNFRETLYELMDGAFIFVEEACACPDDKSFNRLLSIIVSILTATVVTLLLNRRRDEDEED